MKIDEDLNAQLLELVRSAIWDKMPAQEMFLSCDWLSLFRLAKVQTVAGLMADAVSRLPSECLPPKEVRMMLIGYMQQIQRMNEVHRKVIKKVYGLLKENGTDAVFMKGLIVGTRYPNPMLRQCGDIDFVVAKKDFEKTLKLLEQIGTVDYELIHEHHGMAFVDGVTLEPHYKVHNYQHPKNDKAMQGMFEEVFPTKLKCIDIDSEPIPVFPESFESVFLISHMVNHVYEEGLGLRQVIDYAMLAHKACGKIDPKRHEDYLRRMHMERAHRVFVRICEKYLGLSPDIWSFQYTDKEMAFADLMTKDIMQVGNFGRGEYVFHRDGMWGDFQNYCWVTKRALQLGYLCPTEAYMWPISKMGRYWEKKKHKSENQHIKPQ